MDTKKLRQKILDLAIHGKLVPQDPNDEPASVLLERIKAEKERLIKEGKIKRAKKSAKSSDTPHYPYLLPKGWKWCKLEDIAYVASGSTPSKESFVSDGIPYIKMYNLRNQKIDFDFKPQYIKPEVHNGKLQRSRTEVGDLIMNIVGPPLGKLAIIPSSLPQANFNQAAVLIRPLLHKAILTKYLFYYLSEMSEIKSIATKGSAGQVNISLTQSQNMRIPLPSLSEQNRIIVEIEYYFDLISTIEQSQSDLQVTIKQTKRKILDLAIHGKLVSQDPNDEPASELLKCINPKAEITCDNGHSEKLPKGWITTQLNNLAEIKNGYAFKSSKYVSSNGVRIIRIANVQDGYIEDKMPQFYPFEEMGILKDFILKDGDMLMSLTGNVGRVGILTRKFLPAALNQRVAHIDERSNVVEKRFLFYLFQTKDFLKDCLKSGKGVAQLNISTEWLKHYIIPLPPLAEQQRIVAKIEELFSVLDDIQKSLEA